MGFVFLMIALSVLNAFLLWMRWKEENFKAGLLPAWGLGWCMSSLVYGLFKYL